MSEIWIGLGSDGVVIARAAEGELLVDRPAQRRYRERTVHNGWTADGVALRPMPPIPADLADCTGWYTGGGRRLLLTQIPEAYFGEPMILVEEGGAIGRAYPLDDRTLVTDDAEMLELTDGGIAGLARCYSEEPVTFTAGEAQLSGTVILPGPLARGPFPAAVIVHGAAGGQRDFCRLQAGPLLDAGLAVLIYDKPGHGRSGGTEPSIFDQGTAVEAAFDHLRTHPKVDPARVGLAGFSNGMWAVPMVAARRGEVAFVAGLGSPGVSMAESEVHRRTKILREAGAGSATLAAVAEAWRCIFATVANGQSTMVSDRLARALAVVAAATDLTGYETPEYVRQNPMLSPIPPQMTADELIAMTGGERDPEVAYEPALDFARVRCPILLQYGADDTSVPVPESMAAIERAVTDPGQLTVRVYPGLEHMLNIVPVLTGLGAEEAMYQFHDFRFGPTVWTDLIAWLTKVLTT
jgi:pimeloyl-ACP methyl ester carboxylesterase